LAERSKMPILPNVGGRFEFCQPCFAFVGVQTASKILILIDLVWSAVGFLNTMFYGMYWYDWNDVQDAVLKKHYQVGTLVQHGSELYYYHRMPVSGLMALIICYCGAACWNFILFHQLLNNNCVKIRHKIWAIIFCGSIFSRPFALLFIISVLDKDYTGASLVGSTFISILFTVYGLWIIFASKKKTLPPRPLIIYEGLN